MSESIVHLGYCPVCGRPVIRDPAAQFGSDGASRIWIDLRTPAHVSCMAGTQEGDLSEKLKKIYGGEHALAGAVVKERDIPPSQLARLLCMSMELEICKYPDGHENGGWWVEQTLKTRRSARLVHAELSKIVNRGRIVTRGKTVRLILQVSER